MSGVCDVTGCDEPEAEAHGGVLYLCSEHYASFARFWYATIDELGDDAAVSAWLDTTEASDET